MKRIIRDSDGLKMYPVCGFQKSQHKLYYWENYFYLHRDESAELWAKWELWQNILDYATCIYDGLIYMPWRFNQIVKEAIVMYDLQH